MNHVAMHFWHGWAYRYMLVGHEEAVISTVIEKLKIQMVSVCVHLYMTCAECYTHRQVPTMRCRRVIKI